ncbi:unnamed protein product [Boreogadus saida]
MNSSIVMADARQVLFMSSGSQQPAADRLSRLQPRPGFSGEGPHVSEKDQGSVVKVHMSLRRTRVQWRCGAVLEVRAPCADTVLAGATAYRSSLVVNATALSHGTDLFQTQ